MPRHVKPPMPKRKGLFVKAVTHREFEMVRRALNPRGKPLTQDRAVAALCELFWEVRKN